MSETSRSKRTFMIEDILNTKTSKSTDENDDANVNDKNGGINRGANLPAWIFCTRYSDRPSSGNKYCIVPYLLTYLETIRFI